MRSSDSADSIHGYEREGAWVGSHGFYYGCAWFEYCQYSSKLKALLAQEAALHDSYRTESPEVVAGLIAHETDALHRECYRTAISAHLFACMAFEGFLNHYGVRRLGEEFYRRQIERLGITEKVAVLVLSCHGLILKADCGIMVNARELFDTRNRLVHPKTRELDLRRIRDCLYEHPSQLPIRKTMTTMESVITDFCSFDPDIRKDFEFPGFDAMSKHPES